MLDENLERLHRALVDAIRQTRGEDFGRPVTVSEIYQELVPYRVARSLVGFDMNADYEYALLRLLSGEGELAVLEPAEVRAQLQRELESPNPNVSVFRAFANCDVFVAPAHGEFVERVMPPPEPAPPPEIATAADAPALPPPEHTGRNQCPHCHGALPPDRVVQFCPHCGRNLARWACSNCGETLERDWRFCPTCGTAAQPRT